MLDFSWAEFAVIGVVALIVIGPKDLPTVLRTAARYLQTIRLMARDFQSNIEDMTREIETADLHREIVSISQSMEEGVAPLVTKSPFLVPSAMLEEGTGYEALASPESESQELLSVPETIAVASLERGGGMIPTVIPTPPERCDQ